LFIMWGYDPLASGSSNLVINSYNVHFNKM
jgi:hypothetical protein